ncbi:aminotransferase class I/II-fold pyridoxal phosphate-dependent enzyme [Helicobacter cappadocius]|uniref:Pyridoxal phosphate-dependent aminotransferase family protein n=1 Tax=Helicobacter cappadocius TaxID=3063998 RepID=A0AA90PS98_9HELI|nr:MULTISPECIES: pyridoxal phosphate-dependent aminotransferase family protein [unclassified Helicobacter]MDO7253353.1 pyridoxal phosphate-dependent aminotransferase family protein [Helicobacter sp. faydin-H75]MDP2539217.1 pyridoxal phosphate-dependent aminotransferase family protein [Helicobacter sp. faydin-H76]
MFEKELNAIKHSGLYRERKIFLDTLKDFASNDYLGLSKNKKLLKAAYKLLLEQKSHSPKASMIVNGYSLLHRELELELCALNGFKDGIILGSGFLANIALFDGLVRKNDKIYIDEKYHASGVYAAKILGDRAVFFKHNDPKDLNNLLETSPTKGRIIIAIEGVYSMDGDLAHKDFAKIAIDKNALLIVDEAHSSGSIGTNLLGYFDYHHIPICPNFIKMGTLSKAYGSYGAYILADTEIVNFLCNRGKSIIYTTALSIFDTALALVNLRYIQEHKKIFKDKISRLQDLVKKILEIPLQSQILIIKYKNTEDMQKAHKELQENGFLVGAIRKPTVKEPILRITLGTKNSLKETKKLCKIIKKSQGQIC